MIKISLALGAALMFSAATNAAVVSTSVFQNFTAAGVNYSAVRVFSGPGLAIADAQTQGQGDAYDYGASLQVDGTVYNPATADVDGTRYQGAMQQLSGLDTQLTYFFSNEDPFFASIARFSNNSLAPITATATFQSNTGADSSQQIFATQSGDLSFTAADSWVVVDDFVDGSADPATGYVFGGTLGLPAVTPSAAYTSTTYSSAGTEGLRADYSFTVPVGGSVGLLFLNTVTSTSAQSEALVSELAGWDVDGFLADPVFGGDAQLFANILNFDFGIQSADPVPAPGPLILLGLGLAGIGALRRKSR